MNVFHKKEKKNYTTANPSTFLNSKWMIQPFCANLLFVVNFHRRKSIYMYIMKELQFLSVGFFFSKNGCSIKKRRRNEGYNGELCTRGFVQFKLPSPMVPKINRSHFMANDINFFFASTINIYYFI